MWEEIRLLQIRSKPLYYPGHLRELLCWRNQLLDEVLCDKVFTWTLKIRIGIGCRRRAIHVDWEWLMYRNAVSHVLLHSIS